MNYKKHIFLAVTLLFSGNVFALENGDLVNFSLVKNMNSDVEINDVKYGSQAGYLENYEFEMGGAGLGVSIEYLKRIKQLDGKKFIKDFEHSYFVSAGVEYHFTREADKGTYSFSDGDSGVVEDRLLKAAEISPLNIYVGFNMLVNNLVMVHVGTAYSTLGYEADTANSNGNSSSTESESTFSFQVGIGALYDDFTIKLLHRSVKYDLDGTAIISSAGTTVEGEIEYNQTMLSIAYLF